MSSLQYNPSGDSFTDCESISHDESAASLLEKSEDQVVSSSYSQRRTLNTTLLMCNIIWTVVGVLFLVFQSQTSQTHESEDLDLFGNIPQEKVVFLPDNDLDDQNHTTQWEDLHSSFEGFVNIQDAHKYGLNGGFPFPPDDVKGEIYCISAFHQLHCLAGIKAALEASPSRRRDIAREKHMEHCFPYLRQAIMCSADLTLEQTLWSVGDKVMFGATGWGNTHQCRSWSAVLEFSKKHRKDVKGFNEVIDDK